MRVEAEKEHHIDTTALRAELKQWENAFREQHGRRAGRDDIRADATIQAKYKLFNSLARPATKVQSATTPRKSKVNTTASATPQRTETHVAAPQAVVSPPREPEPTPAFIRNALGPTPHRDGQVLGIFDLMPDETPEKGASPANGHDCVAGTPSRSAARLSETSNSRTPQSSSKRFFLGLFEGTPLKRKRDEQDVGTGSSSKCRFATPSFLRRSAPLAPISEDNAEDTGMPPPFKRRGLVRSLSSMIQGLRKEQEKQMDDEWDVMNEIEEEQDEGNSKKRDSQKVLVEDSQAVEVEMPLGPDKGVESSEDSGPEAEKNRKVWKKKGQKRTTKRSNMKPVLYKAKKAEHEEESDDGEDQVAETQVLGPNEDALSGSDHDDAKTRYLKKVTKEAASKKESTNNDKNAAKKRRKIDPNALAHANFRALKIKNKNSKGKGGGRFGRR